MHLILGFGATGASYLRYLNKKNISALIMDSRDSLLVYRNSII
ncbi:MAG: hypothetical protein Ct9H300mP20_14990 [Gammaproteobacteria bacterium]|nr:MAG: hypothetical protein Ct9H300mP20_14990 [Gammaproteobacteria bacterium]